MDEICVMHDLRAVGERLIYSHAVGRLAVYLGILQVVVLLCGFSKSLPSPAEYYQGERPNISLVADLVPLAF